MRWRHGRVYVGVRGRPCPCESSDEGRRREREERKVVGTDFGPWALCQISSGGAWARSAGTPRKTGLQTSGNLGYKKIAMHEHQRPAKIQGRGAGPEYIESTPRPDVRASLLNLYYRFESHHPGLLPSVVNRKQHGRRSGPHLRTCRAALGRHCDRCEESEDV